MLLHSSHVVHALTYVLISKTGVHSSTIASRGKHVNTAQTLLKKQFSQIGGLQPPILSLTGHWQVMSLEGIHANITHWNVESWMPRKNH